jgi:AcrR family transcriptional regulator
MSFRRDSYHHGNLREALVEAALRLITERGLAGFAFAELARAAGVSPAAPYRHFRDRNALLAELARRGFEQLQADLEHAWNQGRPDPALAIERCGRAHLAFARRDPASYAAMFDFSTSDPDPALKAAADAAFAVIRRAADAACAAAATAPRPPALMVALHVWSLCHGVAALFIGPPSPARRPLPMSAEDLLEAGLLVYLRSLGLGTITSP